MPVEIPLTRGLVALVDEADAGRVLTHRWYVLSTGRGHFYAATRAGQRKHLLMHRLLTDAPAGVVVDHIDGCGLNNTRANLRLCSNAENRNNSIKRRPGTTPYRGVTYRKSRGDFIAYFSNDAGRYKHIGVFRSADAAAIARDDAVRAKNGAFATYNFPRSGERSAITGEIAP